ncbi:MAG: hypothetical protein Q9203_002264 [Teloschistes exilis]
MAQQDRSDEEMILKMEERTIITLPFFLPTVEPCQIAACCSLSPDDSSLDHFGECQSLDLDTLAWAIQRPRQDRISNTHGTASVSASSQDRLHAVETAAFLRKGEEIRDEGNEEALAVYDVRIEKAKGGFKELTVKVNGTKDVRKRPAIQRVDGLWESVDGISRSDPDAMDVDEEEDWGGDLMEL